MKVSIERNTLLRAMSRAQGVVERRTTIPILSNVLIEADGDRLSFRATDLDIEVVDRVAAQVERAGATTVPAVAEELGSSQRRIDVAVALRPIHVGEDPRLDQ